MRQTFLGIAAFTVLGLAAPADAATVNFIVSLSGAQEVGAGDPDGSGTAYLAIDNVANTISWNIIVSNITLPPTGAHIHNAPAGVNGGVVVDFSSQLSGSGLFDIDLANVLANPVNFYVNIHNSNFPGGAIRGQLGAPIPVPAAVWLFGGALAGLAVLKRRPAIAGRS